MKNRQTLYIDLPNGFRARISRLQLSLPELHQTISLHPSQSFFVAIDGGLNPLVCAFPSTPFVDGKIWDHERGENKQYISICNLDIEWDDEDEFMTCMFAYSKKELLDLFAEWENSLNDF